MAEGAGTTIHKIVVVLNKKIEVPRLINACAHITACLAATVSEEERKNMLFVEYVDADGGKHPISALSLVVLKARNSNQIRKVRNEAIGMQLPFVDFTETMTQATYAEQMERTKEVKETDLDYWGIGLFGKKVTVDSITGKLSLWR
ncbi:DUF2000 domain-containing protein [Desulfococcaceae bacterium HSG9]|nr:DUF2000 domain-containing protein [Desulfococcaceae bacterium HSG9]